jgi:hypothetical protein
MLSVLYKFPDVTFGTVCNPGISYRVKIFYSSGVNINVIFDPALKYRARQLFASFSLH